MGMSDRMDVIDLIITVLGEHEGTLDGLVKRLEKIHLDLEESVNESGFAMGGSAGDKVLEVKVQELESRLKKYTGLLNDLLHHCESINDVVCLKKMASSAIES